LEKQFGLNQRVYIKITREKDGFKAVSEDNDFELKMKKLPNLLRWLRENIPNYRSNEHEFGREGNERFSIKGGI